MLPIKLEIKNFLSYKDASVEFAGLGLASLVGKNGAGKSSLLDCILWALFGKCTRGNKDGTIDVDSIISDGEVDCFVEFSFKLNGNMYQVVRGRSRARNKTTLEFFVAGSLGMVPLSGKGIKETQEIIEKTIRMDYKTFTSSSLILQGQSNSFTGTETTDGDRKKILASILGLDFWDDMQERAKAGARELQDKIKVFASEVDRLSQSAHQIPVLVKQQEAYQADLQCFNALTGDLNMDIQNLEAQLADEKVYVEQLKVIDGDFKRIGDQSADVASKIAKIHHQTKTLEDQMKNAQGILARESEIEQALELEKDLAEQVRVWEEKAEKYYALMEPLSRAVTAEGHWQGDIKSKASKLKAEIAGAQKQVEVLEKVPCQKGWGLETDETCPLIKIALDAQEFLKTAPTVESILTTPNPYAEEIAGLQAQIKELGFSQQSMQECKNRLTKVQTITRLKSQLDQARQLVQINRERITELDGQKAEFLVQDLKLQNEIPALETHRDLIQGKINKLQPLKQELNGRKLQLKDNQDYIDSTIRNIARVEASLEIATKDRETLQAKEKEIKDIKDKLQVLGILDDACNKKGGVPALIIENAVPQIEKETNERLESLMGGRLKIQMNTQIEGKTTGTMAEGLEILASDMGNWKKYQMYSGAEKFVLDLAIRAGMAKFLSHRAGAEVSLFVLDEGLGSLDSENQAPVVEAIKTVSQEFGMTLVITHIETLQDMMPNRVEVIKTLEGSKVFVR